MYSVSVVRGGAENVEIPVIIVLLGEWRSGDKKPLSSDMDSVVDRQLQNTPRSTSARGICPGPQWQSLHRSPNRTVGRDGLIAASSQETPQESPGLQASALCPRSLNLRIIFDNSNNVFLTTDAVSPQQLHSASRHQLIVPRHRRTNSAVGRFLLQDHSPKLAIDSPWSVAERRHF